MPDQNLVWMMIYKKAMEMNCAQSRVSWYIRNSSKLYLLLTNDLTAELPKYSFLYMLNLVYHSGGATGGGGTGRSCPSVPKSQQNDAKRVKHPNLHFVHASCHKE